MNCAPIFAVAHSLTPTLNPNRSHRNCIRSRAEKESEMSRMNPGIRAREVSISFAPRDLAPPPFRYKRVLLTTFLFVFGAVAFLGLAYLRRYESHMVIQVSRERLDPLATTDAANQTPFDLTD